MYWRTSCGKPYTINLGIIKSWCIVSKVFDKTMNVGHTCPPLSSIIIQISNMYIRQCCVLYFFLKPVNRFDSLSCMKASTWMQMIFSNTFDKLIKHWQAYKFIYLDHRFLFVFLFVCLFFWKISLTSASFKSSGKHPFSNDKLMIFVVSGRCVSSVTLRMSAGMFPTGVNHQ